MGKKLLKPACLIGLALSVSLGIFIFVTMQGIEVPQGFSGRFARELAAFDHFDAPRRVLYGESLQSIEQRFSRLQAQAQTAAEYLSVLKRRRELAALDRRFIAYYQRAAHEAAETFPFSPVLAIVAAEAALLENSPQSRALLPAYAERVTQTHFAPLELSLHVLAGNLDDPLRAVGIPGIETLISLNLPSADFLAEDFLVNEFLLRAVRRDTSGAVSRLNTLLTQTDSLDIQRMAAEFLYDHHNPRAAAGIFASLAGESGAEQDILRLADALALSGEIPAARNVWLLLASTPIPGFDHSRILYNMAASSASAQEQASWLQRLFVYRAGQNRTDAMQIYSLIRYTRLLEDDRAAAILLETVATNAHPLLELELLRRDLVSWPPTRAAAEVWLLLNRHYSDQSIHQWAAWYFEHQRRYTEVSRLLSDAVRGGMTGTWIDLHQALALLRAGELAEGERILREAGAISSDWRIHANLGRIYESRRQFSAALGAYEMAAAIADERAAAAQVQLRLSRNLEALGRGSESRAALERAQELDPNDLIIRRELRRVGSL